MARGAVKGFTLIEIMISVAILAILASVAVASILQFRGALRERDYQRALHNAQQQVYRLREAKFETLPPEVVKVGAGGTVRLSQANLVEGSVKVLDAQTLQEVAASATSLENGTLTVAASLAGKSVVVDYRFRMGELGEPHFLEKDGGARLLRSPVQGVDAVYVASGGKLTPTTRFTLQGDRLQVQGAAADQLVVVDYRSEDANEVGGRFLSKTLEPSLGPTDTRMLTVREPYRGPFRMSLPLLKVRP